MGDTCGQMSRAAALIARLEAICGSDYVLTHPHALATYRSDGLAHLRQMSVAAVLPGSAEEVQAVVALCHEAQIPWVARGAGTGLSGGALPVHDGLLIVLSRLRRIRARPRSRPWAASPLRTTSKMA